MLGLTPPLSKSKSTDAEIELAKSLVTTLTHYNVIEAHEKTRLREAVLKKLDAYTKQAVRLLCVRKGVAEPDRINAIVRPYGSYAIGVHAEDADIDTLCLLPSILDRAEFFEVMYNILSTVPDVTNLVHVASALVPLLKFKYMGIQIDLICTIMNLLTVPDDLDVSNVALLEKMSDPCIRSLNGVRVAKEIRGLVPNFETFQTVVRAVKLWASLRGIYSNPLGFFGGVAWAITVARVCQLYPNYAASTILCKYFRIMSQWQWPSPVMLRSVKHHRGISVRSWTPTNHPEHIMPVITPSFPATCTTHNVSKSTSMIMLGELKYAADLMDRIIVGAGTWADLFNKRDFFTSYGHYIRIVVSADNLKDLLASAGFAESRLRSAVTALEREKIVAMAHPYADPKQVVTHCTSAQQLSDATGVPLEDIHQNVLIDTTIYTKSFYIGLYLRFVPSGPGSLSIDLTEYVYKFKMTVENSEYFHNGRSCLAIDTLTRKEVLDKLTRDKLPPRKRSFDASDQDDASSAAPSQPPSTHTSPPKQQPSPTSPATLSGPSTGPSSPES